MTSEREDHVHYQHFPHISESLFGGLGAILDHWESAKIQGSIYAPKRDSLDALRDAVSNTQLGQRWNRFSNTLSLQLPGWGYGGELSYEMHSAFKGMGIEPKDILTMAGCDFDRLMKQILATSYLGDPDRNRGWRGELATIEMIHPTEKLTLKQNAHTGKQPYYHVLQSGGYIDEYTMSTCAVDDGILLKGIDLSRGKASEQIAAITCNMPTHTLKVVGARLDNGDSLVLTRQHLKSTLGLAVAKKEEV